MSSLTTPAQLSTESKGRVAVEIDRDRLKHVFYLLHGESGSRTKVFPGAILVTKQDLERLIFSIVDQLKVAHVREYTINVGVGFEKEIVEKNFADFRSYSWGEPNKTKELIVKINFLYEDYDSGNPLKHAFFLRIARQINPGNFFQILASSDAEKLDNFESLLSPVFCRTDHINDELSKVLINVVSDWHKGQKQPQLLSTSYRFAKAHKERVARLVHYSYPAVSCFIVCLAALKLPAFIPAQSQPLPFFVVLIVLGMFLNTFFTDYGGRRARDIFNTLKTISGEDVIFEITQGDNKDYSERINKNNEAFSTARNRFAWSMGLNITASLLAAIVYEYLK